MSHRCRQCHTARHHQCQTANLTIIQPSYAATLHKQGPLSWESGSAPETGLELVGETGGWPSARRSAKSPSLFAQLQGQAQHHFTMQVHVLAAHMTIQAAAYVYDGCTMDTLRLVFYCASAMHFRSTCGVSDASALLHHISMPTNTDHRKHLDHCWPG